MWYLVLYMVYVGANSIAIAPDPYPTEQACYEAAKVWEYKAKCIPAPERKE